MLRSIRYRDSASGLPQLGLVEGAIVYNVTSIVHNWTDPISLWTSCRALQISPSEAFERLARASDVTVELELLIQSGALLAPVVAEEVWAAGVTYERSREARNAETKLQDSVYDRVYNADRPEIFFKATADRVVAPGHHLGLRSDSHWMVPEPELAVVIASTGEIIGWTIGNDLSSRDIEGENPLYLPQAKVFSKSCTIGPTLVWNTGVERPIDWTLSLAVYRDGVPAFEDAVPIRQLRRSVQDLVSYLLRDNFVPNGTVLLTGTGIVPPDEFTLHPGDIVDICVEEIGTLHNPIAAPLGQ